MSINVCLLVPHFNHHQQLIAFLPQLKEVELPIIIVDDGSDEQSYAQLQAAVADQPWCTLQRMPLNRGKGAAAKTGMILARLAGYSHVLQIDADGQHDTQDIEKIIALGQEHPKAIISGKPVFADDAPKARVYGRKVTDFWVALETLSLQVQDSLCGFRLYPLAEIDRIADHYYLGSRMDFDTEILVKAVWLGVAVKFIPTKVIYPEANISHFRYLRDNLALIKLHTRLMLGMLLRWPLIIYRRLSNKGSVRGQQNG